MTSNATQTSSKFSYLKSTNVEYIDEMLNAYMNDPESVDSSWRYFFEGIELGSAFESNATEPAVSVDLSQEVKVAELIAAYREYGHLIANVNPLSPASPTHPLLDLARFQLSSSDLQNTYQSGKLLGMGPARLQDILAQLKATYTETVAAEFAHIVNSVERDWLRNRMESSRNREALDAETQKFILHRLSQSEGFERFLHTRYVAQKRFSVEGAESIIPALDVTIELGAELGAKEFVFGMAHRGRLNVLTHIFGKKPEYIFTEFEGTYKIDLSIGDGDVKYHMGYSRDFTTRFGKAVHLSLANNPSHLEFVNPVVEGITRSKQKQLGDTQRAQVIPILIHGDAALAGQGVCYETLGLAGLEGYNTGGTLHFVVNNQVGFTTSPNDSRSWTYSTDMAKTIQSPIFHVNGDAPEAVWFASKLALEFRQKFKKDVFIDLICYRKHGHNEGDEPSFTQPLMYKQIKVHPSTRELYAKKLESENRIPAGTGQAFVDEITAYLLAAQQITKAEAPHPAVSVFAGHWKNLKRPSTEDIFRSVDTSVASAKLKALAEKISTLPQGFNLHPKLQRFFEGRLKAAQEGAGIDWGNGEAMAFASLLSEGHTVRVSGQDAERGTFTHRHAVVTDFENGKKHNTLASIAQAPASFEVHNSHLSETGVMGFEYGYSLTDPNALVIWEGQFGDFANGAQVIIDQFLVAGESKWQRMSGLTLLLPHGYEGQGPEHSSARMERFLQLCATNNMSVCNFTTPAQLFHALRRQVKRNFRRPMVIMSPKSLLRHPKVISEMKDFTEGRFEEVLIDPLFSDSVSQSKVKKVILCSGKIYYDLLNYREEQKINDVALLRIEQLYPWPADRLKQILADHKNAKTLVWCQEEPRNMGAWSHVFGFWAGTYDDFGTQIGRPILAYAGRDAAASPAVGSSKVHEKQQKALIEKAFQI